MPDVSYESLQSQLGQQRQQITTQRETIGQEKIVGEKSIQSLKRVHPRTPPSAWFGERKPQIESIKGRLTELGTAEKELTEAEKQLSEQEQLLAEKKKEGWQIRGKDGGYEFYEVEPVSADVGGRPRGDFTVRVKWRTSSGEVRTVRGPASNLGSMESQIADRGGTILNVESLGGGREYRTPEMRTTTGASFLLYEAPEIVQKPTETLAKIGLYTSIYERLPDVGKRILATPEKVALSKGIPSDVFQEAFVGKEVQTETRVLSEVEIQEVLKGKSPAEKIVGEKSIQSLKRVHPRTPPSAWFGERKPQIESIKGRLTELGTAEKELTEAEKQLSEQEQLLAEKKKEGWQIRGKDGGYEFYKVEPVSADVGGRPRGDFTVRVKWRTSSGEVRTVRGPASNLGSMESQIADRGGTILNVESLGGGREYRTPEMRTTTGASFLLYEAPEIVQKPTETLAKIGLYTSIYERLPDVGKRILATPEKVALSKGIPSDVFQEAFVGKEVQTETRVLSEVEIQEVLKGKSPAEKISWYKSNVRFGDEKKTWSEIKSENPDWALKVKDGDVVVATPETDQGLLFEAMSREYQKSPGAAGFVRAGTIAFLSAFRPETIIAGFKEGAKRGGPLSGGVLGIPSRIGRGLVIETIKWEYSVVQEKDLQKRWLAVAEPGYMNVVIPFAIGAGFGKVFQFAAKLAPAYGKCAEIIARGTPLVIGGGISAVVGADIGYTAALEEQGLVKPDTTIGKIGKYGMQFTFAGLGAKWAMKPATGQTFRRFMLRTGEVKPFEETFIDKSLGKYEFIGKTPKGRLITIQETARPTGKPKIIITGKPKVPVKISGRFAIGSRTLLNPDYFVKAEPPVILTEYVPKRPGLFFRVFGPRIIEYPRPVMFGGIRAMIGGRVGPIKEIITPEKPASIPDYLKHVAGRYQEYSKLPTRYYYTGEGRVRSIFETFPKVEISIKGDPIFTKQIQTEVGTYLEYTLRPLKGKGFFEIRTLSYVDEGLIPETVSVAKLKGTGQIFKPKLPGYYQYSQKTGTFMGEKKLASFIRGQAVEPVYIGQQEAVDIFWGEVSTKVGRELMVATGKLYIPKKIMLKGALRTTPISPQEFGKAYPSFETPPKSDVSIQNIARDWYLFQTQARTTTSAIGKTVGIGKTFPELGYKIKGALGGYEIEVTPYRTTGVFETITPEGKITGRVSGRGTIYDLTQAWKGGIVEGKDLTTAYKILTMQRPTPISYTQVATKQIVQSLKSDIVPLTQQPAKTILPTKVAVSKITTVIPKQIISTSVIQKSMTAFFPIFDQPTIQETRLDIRQVQEVETEITTRQIERQLTRLIPREETKQIPRVEEKILTRQIEKQITKPMIKQIERQLPKMEEKQVTKQAVKLLEKQMLKQTIKQMMKTTIKYAPFDFIPINLEGVRTIIKKPIFEETIMEFTPKPPAFILPDTPYKLFGPTTGQGYNVKIKERHYVKGEKVKEGRFIKINKKPLSLRNAESLRGMVLDNSAAASGKIVPTNAFAQESLIKLKPFEDIQHKFYLKDDILIEKTKHRIDTKGEIKGISAKGWYADRTKQVAKIKPVVSRQRVIQKPEDVFDMGMENMMVNLDKIFKGGNNIGIR